MKKWAKNATANRVLAVVFVLFTLHAGLAALPNLLGTLSDMIKAEEHSFTTVRDAVDKIYTDGMLSTKLEQPLLQNKGTYINLNGLMARLMGQRNVNGIVRMNNGHLTDYKEAHKDIQSSIEQITRLYEHQKNRGKENGFLFVLAPIQISRYEELMPIGYQKDTRNEDSDMLLRALEENHVPVLNLREEMNKQGISSADAFFVTDHHWTPRTGFWAYGEIIKRLEQMGAIPEVPSFYTDPAQYEFKRMEKQNLGSQGRRTGRYYAGVDDFDLIIPRFETNMAMQVPSFNIDRSGCFEDVIYNKSQYAKIDYFNIDAFAAYGYSTNIAHIYNENAPIKKRAMLIGDSFSRVTSSLLPLCIETCDKLDMRFYEDNFAEYYDEFDPDLMVVVVYPESIGSIHTTYDFFPDNPQ